MSACDGIPIPGNRTLDGKQGMLVSVGEKSNAIVPDGSCVSWQKNSIVRYGLSSPDGCSHDVVYPPGVPFQPLKYAETSARSYGFKLDGFQRLAIRCIDNLQSVLVSAHTSAGKTVVAEYAIALALKKNQRVIYTTPIKALSNQKYREFLCEFSDVGLMTGDVTINSNASCLIMTTEILRSMLYRGSEILREIGWVVFDEIHYMRDMERGYVWEETIILLEDQIKMVFLSATVPNARQFAEWVVDVHKQPVHVIYTEYRPVPLQHFLYPSGGKNLYLVVDVNGEFCEDTFKQAMAALDLDEDAALKCRKQWRDGADAQSVTRMVRMFKDDDLTPAIVFSFSKRECERLAAECNKKLNFNSSTEKELVQEVFDNAIDILNDDDKDIAQLHRMLPMLLKGIGVHHGGLIPILKEIIEILFGEGLIKLLFATETFAMGMNMPARTVMFTSARKFDGKEERWLHGAEYIQMSGRAGRRDSDQKGFVVFLVDEKMSPAVGRQLLTGGPEKLTSSFQLTYNMVLNLLRVNGVNPEFILRRSFRQFQAQEEIPTLIEELRKSKLEFDNITVEDEDSFETYREIRQLLDKFLEERRSCMMLPQHILHFLTIGRLVEIHCGESECGWGVVVSKVGLRHEGTGAAARNASGGDREYEFHVLLPLPKEAGDFPAAHRVADRGGSVACGVWAVGLADVKNVSVLCVTLPTDDLVNAGNMAAVMEEVRKTFENFGGKIPLLHPFKDVKMIGNDAKVLASKIQMLEERLSAHPLFGADNLEKNYELYLKKRNAWNRMLKAGRELDAVGNRLQQQDELEKMMRVLQKLGYCNAKGDLRMKGRVACELSSADELLVAEMLFDGVFLDMTAPEVMALLSCLICDETPRGADALKFSERLGGPLQQLRDIAQKLGDTYQEFGLQVNVRSYVASFKPYLMDVVHEWCKGSSFTSILSMTEIYEGSIIRCMRLLEEVSRQLIQASRAMGNKEIEQKFVDGNKLLKRGVVFAASLYL